MAGALDNLKILDFSRAFAGPFCTELLRELGAEVIKVEFVEVGDYVRTFAGVTKGGEGLIFIELNRGKKSITLNVQSERGQQIALDLVKRADVLVENFSPGVMDRLNLGYNEVRKVNPKIIYASVSGFGQTGHYQSTPVFDLIAQAMGGIMGVTGFPNNPPTKVGTSIADYLSGIFTAIAILAALHHQQKTGEGQRIDISMQDCVWLVTALDNLPPYFLYNRIPQRRGNGTGDQDFDAAGSGTTASGIIWGTYQAKDGYVVICVVAIGQWQRLAKIIGQEHLAEKYPTLRERGEHMDEVNGAVKDWVKIKTVEEVVSELGNAHLPCSPLPAFDEVVNDPQLLSREMIVEVEQVISGKVKVPGSVFKLSKTPGDPRPSAPYLGEHNYEIYQSQLGYSEAEINKLSDEGII